MLCPVVVGRATELDRLDRGARRRRGGRGGRRRAGRGGRGRQDPPGARPRRAGASRAGWPCWPVAASPATARCRTGRSPRRSRRRFREPVAAARPAAGRLRRAPRPARARSGRTTPAGARTSRRSCSPRRWCASPTSPPATGPATLLVLEDLHWADVETLAVVDYLADTLRDQPVLCLCTTPARGASGRGCWRACGGTTASRSLERRRALPPDDVRDVVAACLGTDAVPPDLLAWIARPQRRHPVPRRGAARRPGVHRDPDARRRPLGAPPARCPPSIPIDVEQSIRQRLSIARPDGPPGHRGGRAARPALRLGAAPRRRRGRRPGRRRRAAGRGRRPDHRGRGRRLPVPPRPDPRGGARRAAPAGAPRPRLAGLAGRRAGQPRPARAPSASWPPTWPRRPANPRAAAERLVESARRALAGGAYATAEATAERARRLAPSRRSRSRSTPPTCSSRSSRPPASRPPRSPSGARSSTSCASTARADVADLLLVLARAALAAGDADEAARLSRRGAGRRPGRPELVGAPVDAVAAYVALDQGRVARRGATLARRAVDGATATAQPAVACEALEVLGRVADVTEPGTSVAVVPAGRRPRRRPRPGRLAAAGPPRAGPRTPGATATRSRCARPATSPPAPAPSSPRR